MPITQDRMTNLLLTVDFYRERQEEMQATIKSYAESSHDPATLLIMLKELAFSEEQRLPHELYSNFVEEKAHFKARGKINLARRRYDAKSKLKKETTFLSGPAVEALKLETKQRAEARLATKAKPFTRVKKDLSPPPPDTPREEIISWENFHGVTYDWSQWQDPSLPQKKEPIKEERAEVIPKSDPDEKVIGEPTANEKATTGRGVDDLFILEEDAEFPSDEVDGQEDPALAAQQAALIARNKQFQSKE